MRSLLMAGLAASCLVAAGALLNTRYDDATMLAKGGEHWTSKETSDAGPYVGAQGVVFAAGGDYAVNDRAA